MKIPAKLFRSTAYVLVIVALLCLTGTIGLLNGMSVPVLLFLAQLLALLLGVLHVYQLYRFMPWLNADRMVPGLVATVLLMLAGILAIVMVCHLFFPAGNYASGASVLPFAVPYLFVWVYRHYLSIPAAEYKQWHYPLGKPMPDLDLVDLSKVLVIQFEFLKKATDTAPTNFKAKAPAQMALGELFLIFLNDYNEQNAANGIQFLDSENKPAGWHFYHQKGRFASRRYFDPDLDFQRNGVGDNCTITARRT